MRLNKICITLLIFSAQTNISSQNKKNCQNINDLKKLNSLLKIYILNITGQKERYSRLSIFFFTSFLHYIYRI